MSVLYALADRDTATSVRAAHDDAVAATLAWLEANACWTRAGRNGIERLRGEGFVAAGFVHRTSRAGDPQLHSHVLVANITPCADGKWRALDGDMLLKQAQTAGYLYKAHLRHALTARLGVEWGPIHKGASEIIGIPPGLLRLFATRRAEIVAELNATGQHGPKAARIAALETRTTKTGTADLTTLRERWQTEATVAGYDLEFLDTVTERDETTLIGPDVIDSTNVALLGADGLTRNTPTFDRRALLRAWCERLSQGAPAARIDELARQTLDHADLIRLGGPSRFGTYTTKELMALEHQLVNQAINAQTGDVAVVDNPALQAALTARPSLAGEQRTAITALTRSGNGIDVFIAAAGTGKTFCLDAAADAWNRSGYRIIGATLAATAAHQLQAQTGIPSDTIALRTIQRAEQPHFFDHRTVLIIDEAAMAGTRDLAPLLDAAATSHTKVVLVGDPKQLDAVNAGGLVQGLAQRIAPVTLVENRRQNELWERDALTQLRAGSAGRAFAEYETHGRIITGPTSIDIRDRMVADWHAATMNGETTIMVAERNTDIDDLNHRARQHLTATRQLRGKPIDIDGNDFKEGERVLCAKNNRRLGVRNGMVATITNIDPTKRAVTIRTDAGDQHVLDASYLDAGHLKYGYALTIHKSQGATVDHCLVLGSDTLDQNRGYTALSRGKQSNRIYLVEQHEPDPEAHHPNREQPDRKQAVIDALSTDRADRLAIDHPAAVPTADELKREVRQHYEHATPLVTIRGGIPTDRTGEIMALSTKHQVLSAGRDEARDTLTKLQAERPTMFGRKEHAAAITTAQIRVNTSENAAADCGDELHIAQRAQARRDNYLTQHAPELLQLTHHENAIQAGLDQIVDRRRNASPGYLTNKLGAPDNTNEHDWRQIVRQIEDYRIRHNITDPMTPIGPPPTKPSDRDRYAALGFRIQKYIDLCSAPQHTIAPPTKRIETPPFTIEEPQQRRPGQGPELGL